MVKTAVLVSGGGTNLQAILDAKAAGKLPHAEISLVVASRPDAYALVRAEKAGVPCAVLRKGKEKPIEQYGRELLELLHSHGIELVVLAGFLTILPENVIQAYPKRILNIHPSLIPSFCGAGFYGLKVHEAALAKGGQGHRSHGAFCQRDSRRRGDHRPEGGGGAPRRHAGSIAKAGDGAGRMDSASPGRGGRGPQSLPASKEETACS